MAIAVLIFSEGFGSYYPAKTSLLCSVIPNVTTSMDNFDSIYLHCTHLHTSKQNKTSKMSTLVGKG